jgi:hypothetical protein
VADSLRAGADVTIKGIPELARALDHLEAAARAEALAHAATAGALVVRDAVRVPVGHEHLSRGVHLAQQLAIKVTVREDTHVSAAVGFFGRTVAALVEFGHLLVKGGKLRAGRRKRKATVTVGHVIGHVPAHPFLRPAFDSSKEEAQQAMAAALWADLSAAGTR